jgi:hypothetical protein
MAFETEGKIFWGFAEILHGGTASRIRVFGEKKNEVYLKYSKEDLINRFQPEGKVFSAQAITSYQTFQVEFNVDNKRPDGDGYIVVKNSWKPINFIKLLEIKELVNPSSLPLEEIKEIGLNNEDGTYFIRNQKDNELLGPFIKDSRGLVPAKGKDVTVYTIDNDFKNYYVFDNDKLLFVSPNGLFTKKAEIDCMSGDQLQDWFRNKLKEAYGLSAERENAIKIMIKMLKEKSLKGANDLDNVRFNRILENLDQYLFSYDHLRDHLLNDGFDKISQKIEAVRNDIKQEYESQLRKEMESLSVEKAKLKKEIDVIFTELNEMKSAKENTEKEIKLLNENRELLMLQFKFSAQMGIHGTTDNNRQNIKPVCYEIQKEGNSFFEIKASNDLDVSLELYYHIIEKNLGRAGYDEKLIKLYKNDENLLLKSQAVFIPCISWAYIYAQSIGNVKVYSMHIEHDWLHYRDFCDNGLVSIWNEAAEEKDKNYILVLEDLNITQPECGLTPLLDVINGYRPVLEGTGFGLPKNLKIFATMIPPEEEKVGLKLSHRIFRKWGEFGNFTDINFLYPVENKQFTPFGYFEPDDLFDLYDNTYYKGGVYFEQQ